MGNRGCLHDDAKNIVAYSRRDAWIICSLEYQDQKRSLMSPGRYTELFFLDEATALAAGHRPCATCRRERYDSFLSAWCVGNNHGSTIHAKDVDTKLKLERAQNARANNNSLAGFPDGTIVAQENTGAYYLIQGRNVFQWSFEGYGPAMTASAIKGPFIVMTPPSTVNTLVSGYAVLIHPSAKRPID